MKPNKPISSIAGWYCADAVFVENRLHCKKMICSRQKGQVLCRGCQCPRPHDWRSEVLENEKTGKLMERLEMLHRGHEYKKIQTLKNLKNNENKVGN